MLQVCVSCAASIKLKALSLNNIALEQAAVGQPFVLEVLVKGTGSNTNQRPKIQGLKDFDYGNTGFEMRTINGDTTIRYKYNVRIDKKGEFEIGPAEIEYDGDIIQSDMITVNVGDTQKEKNGKRQAGHKVNFDFFADKQKVVVGETVKLVLRFYYLEDADIELKGFTLGNFKGVNQTKKEGPLRGEKGANGDTYKYIEYTWNIFPTESGKITLPANRADFTVRTDNGFFRGFSLLGIGGLGREQKVVYSNAITLEVDPLPSYTGVVNAVGEFRSFTASVDRAMAKQGDGIVLTLEVEGNADLDHLNINKLQGMPEALRYYDSKQYIVDKNSNFDFKKKKFEFIVQGMEKGEWLIPKQIFTYFDVKSREYKTLRTSSIMLKILPAPIAVYKPPLQEEKSVAPLPEKDEPMIRPIIKKGEWYSAALKPIPFIAFLLLLLIPLLLMLFSWIKILAYKYSATYKPLKLQRQAFANASKRVKIAMKKKDLSMLYSIFITMFAQKFASQEAYVSQDMIIQTLHEKGFSKKEIDAWERFFANISAFAFYEKGGTVAFDKKIFDEAFDWVQKLRKRL